jgi:phospholipid/cholesterol/gamma-HCH transport system substrate-binding protein
MDLHYRREVAVGGLVLVGLAIFVLGTMWLRGRSVGPGRGTIAIAFPDAGNLKRGNPVKVSGVTVGNVEDIRLEEAGRVLVRVSLEPRIRPRVDASATLSAVGLVGDVVVNFHPGSAPEPLPPGQIVAGRVEEGLSELGGDLAGEARAALRVLQEVVNRRLADDLRATLASIDRLASTFADTQRGPTADLTATMGDLRLLSRRMDSLLASPLLERALANADTLTSRLSLLSEQFSGTATRLDTLLARINRGDGTAGRLARDTTLYTQLTELSASLRAFLDDLRRHPGKLTVQVRIF